MKKHLLFYLVFLFLATNAWAQSNTVVTVGTAVTAAGTNGPIVMDAAGPTSIYSRHIAIYPATSINATPFTQRVLTKIAWYKEDTVHFNAPGGSLKIYVKQTTATATGGFSGANWTTEIVGATQVASISNPKITTGSGWKEFTLPSPIIWDGTSNLEIFVDWTGVSPVSNTQQWRYSAGQANASATMVGQNQPINGISVNNVLANIQFTFTSFNNDGGITAVNAPVSPITPAVSTPVKVTIKNFGANAITAANIGWKVNGVSQPDYAYSGNLASGATDGPITIGNFTFPIGVHKLKAYIKTVNGGVDPLAINDTSTVQLVACSALSGSNYTINKNIAASATNFKSFNDLAQILNSCGVSGPVTVTVAPTSGPYNENFSLVNIQGTSATNTITIEGNGNTLASPNEAVVKLDRAHYVKINNLIINQTNPNGLTASILAYGVQIIGSTEFATISNCTINLPPASTSFQNVIGILIGSGSNSNTQGNYCNNGLFQNNTISGGYYSMRITGFPVTGQNPTGAANNRIIGNQFREFVSYGLYVSYADGARIEGNEFTRPTRTDVTAFNGINIATGSVNCVVSKNRFHNTHGGATSNTSGVVCVQLDAAAGTGVENTIKNNLMYDLNNTGAITGISVNSSASGVNIYHNTISIESQIRPASNTSLQKGLNVSGAGNNVKFINNIVTINAPGTGNKAAIYLASATTTFTSNNNVLNIAAGQTNAFTGFLTSGKVTLADWRATNTTTPYDMNSVAFNPAYAGLATGNLKPTSPDVNNVGQTSPVTDDINNDTRSTTTPDPGAYEFDLGTLDAGVIAITSPTTPTTPGVSTPITVNLKNFGTANLTSGTIGWKVNGVMQPDYNWTGTLVQNAIASVTIGNFTFADGSYSICAWSKGPNGGADVTVTNDSSCTAVNACLAMAGNYTINKNIPTSATNFNSFGAAAQRLHNCGVSAKVNISVVTGTGPYNEQVDLLSIPGVSATNRVVFLGNGNTLTAIPTTTKATILKLDNADYVKLHDLNITVGGTQNVSNPPFIALQMVNNSDNDTISNCTITMPYTTATNAYYLGVFAGTPGSNAGNIDFDVPGNNTNNSVFLNNTVKGGLYGIKINGNVGSTDAVNNRIVGNTILDVNAYGIGLFNTDGALVEGNEIKRPTLVGANTIYAIRLDGASKNNKISKNRILNLWGASISTFGSSYGIYSSGAGAQTGSENIVSNNIFNDTNTPQNSYGIYNLGNSGIFYYYNTIYTKNPGVSYGFYQITAVSNVKFINNNVSINSTGSGNKYAIYFAPPTSNTIQSNNNNLHVGSAVSAVIGSYQNTDYSTLASWKTANTNAYDQNSVSADPFFVNATAGNFAPMSPNVNNIAQPIVAVTTDITEATRNAATPDPGAYEFSPILNDVGVIAIVNPISNCGLTNQETVTVTIKNFGATTQTSIPVNYVLDGGTPVTATWTGSLAFNATVNYTFATKANLSVQGPHTIVAKTILPGDAIAANDATTATVNNSTQASLPATFNFETAATGLNAMRIVTKANSTVTDGAGASFGTGSTKGIIMDGVDNAAWILPIGTTDPWTNNTDNFSSVNICLAAAGATDSLWLTFDLKQLFKVSNANTNFRVTVNGTQVGPTYRPPFSGTPINWQKVKLDLTAYKGMPVIQIGLESSVKEAYANGNGTANLLDNIVLKRRIINGTKSDVMASQIHVFPNPSKGQFNIDLPAGKAYQLEVTDLTGKFIMQKTANGNAQLNLENTAKGIYLLKVSGENGTATRKLIIE